MELPLALTLFVVLAAVVDEVRRRYFRSPHRWKWVVGWGVAFLVGYPIR